MHYRQDLQKIAQQAREKVFACANERVDVIVSTNALHVGYIGGYRSVMLDADRTYRCGIVSTREKTLLITGASDAAPALEVFDDPACIYRYGEFYIGGVSYAAMPPASSNFFAAMQAALLSVVEPRHTVGVDVIHQSDAEPIASALRGARSLDAKPFFTAARSTKSDLEVEKLATTSAMTEHGIQMAFDHARAGVSELDLSTIIYREIIAAGGIPRFVVVTSGLRSALVDAYATTAKLRQGDLLRIDVGCTVDGYWADTARTAVVGEPTRMQSERYAAILDGELAQMRMARPGIEASSLFRVAVDAVRRGALAGYQRTHCGHGLGLTAHEFPSLAANNETVLKEGMVLCVETPYYELGWGGMMVEDTILITADGNRPLTKADRHLRVI